MNGRKKQAGSKDMEIILRTETWDVQGNTATYAIGPLSAGYGMTLGSGLQRVLVTSLPGAAVTMMRLAGVQSGTQRITGVVEEIDEIVLNVKRLCVRSFSEQGVSMSVNVSGKRVVTAADLVGSPIVEIVTPDLPLATLTDEDAHLNMEVLVERGRGYVPAPASMDASEGEWIQVDAIYTPVQAVKMRVEKMRVGQMTNYDRLLLTLTTDGTITPDEAFKQAAEILVRQFAVIAAWSEAPDAEAQPTHLSTVPIPWEVYKVPLEELGLSIRTYNRLKRNGLQNVGQVLALDGEDLQGIRNFGEKSLLELAERLRDWGFLPVFSEEGSWN